MLLARHLITKLVRIVRTSSAPFDAEDLDAWRLAIASGLNDALGGVCAQMSLAPLEGVPRMVAASLDESVVEEYFRDWMHRDPLYDALGTRTTYTGSGLYQTVPSFSEAYRRAAIFPDFFAKNRIRDTAAIIHVGPPFVQLAVFTERWADPVFMECAQPMLDVIEPVLVPAACSVIAYHRIVRSFAREIDESETPTAIYSFTGRALHRNPAFARIVRAASREVRLEAALELLVRDARRRVGAAGELRIDELLRAGAPLHRTAGPWRLSLLIAERGLGGSPPIFVVSATPVSRAPSPLAALSAREQEVAALIAAGCSTREIGDRLAISVHTVRRHTERVFAKLGVRSRAQVAGVWGRYINAAT